MDEGKNRKLKYKHTSVGPLLMGQAFIIIIGEPGKGIKLKTKRVMETMRNLHLSDEVLRSALLLLLDRLRLHQSQSLCRDDAKLIP